MKATLILAAATLLAATQAPAQETQLAAAPTCAEQGRQLIAVMVPLGRTEEEVRALADSGALAPRGTAVAILPLSAAAACAPTSTSPCPSRPRTASWGTGST
jgi:hypothetical protein